MINPFLPNKYYHFFNRAIGNEKIFVTEGNYYFIMQQFSKFHNSYTKAFNKLFTRKGRLFLESFQRKEIVEESYFTKIIHYIHTNPIHHGFVKDFMDWHFSSYNSLLSNSSTQLKREEVFD